ncbi:hypothetical protein CIP103987_01906 [Corynebacterium diphtheriae]|nr:hypothetical protein CIP103987_01906 [Corynebacterium diphtheriae]CAB0568219.1 hypothetical protein CIP107526_01961 [Corynebacterium diphtheriae]
MTDQSAIKPSVGTIVTSTALATLLAGGAAAGAVAMTIPHPQRENYVVSNQEQYRPSHSVAVEIHDRDGVLNAEDQRRVWYRGSTASWRSVSTPSTSVCIR